MAKDAVSKQEWSRRRAKMDKDLAADEKDLKSLKGDSPKYAQKVSDRYKLDRNYKDTYSEELGYSKKVGKKKGSGKAVQMKDKGSKRTSRKRG